MSAAEHLREAIDVGCTRDDHDHVADHRAEVLAEATERHAGAYRKIQEVLDYLAEKDAVKLSEDAGAMGFHIVAILDGPGPRADEVPVAAAVRAQIRAAVLAEVADLAERFTERWPDMDAMKAAGIIGPFTVLGALADELRRMATLGKDTGSARQAPAGESTQPAPALCPCRRFPVVHRADLHDEHGLVRDITPVATGIWGALVQARCGRCGWQSRQSWFHEDFVKSPAQTTIAHHRDEATGKCTAGGDAG